MRPIGVVAPEARDRVRAAELARELEVPLLELSDLDALEQDRPQSDGPQNDRPQNDDTSVLVVQADGLDLRLAHGRRGARVLRVDFCEASLLHRLRSGGREPLVKAMRGKRGPAAIEVVDATGGLGIDAFVMAHRGMHVTMIERNPALFAMLRDALQRADQHSALRKTVERIEVICADSRQALVELVAKRGAPFDAAYLDPMFPSTYAKGSALPKRDMQALRGFVQEDPAGDLELLAAARRAARRVVVKRPRKADAIGASPASRSVLERSCRYDIYLA